jgi:hypothetical protein
VRPRYIIRAGSDFEDGGVDVVCTECDVYENISSGANAEVVSTWIHIHDQRFHRE